MDEWMDGSTLNTPPVHSEQDDAHVKSWVSVCPRGLWQVQQLQTGSSSYCPRLGSLCQVRVQLKADKDASDSSVSERRNEKLSIQSGQSVTELTEKVATVFPRREDSVLQVPLGDWITLRLGDGQCDVTEACVERMAAGEKCEILISPLENGPDVSVSHPGGETLPLHATVELKAFTPGKESWEMCPGEKWEWVKSHKERGGVRFRNGDVWGAADSYSRALRLLITLYGYVGEVKKKELEQEAKERDTNTSDTTQHPPSVDKLRITKAELHSNLSLCQLKLNKPELAKASAAKATQLDPDGAKAWYRLGQACQMVDDLEEARQAFRKLLEIQPESPAALKALKNIASRERETNTQLGLRLSKMFS